MYDWQRSGQTFRRTIAEAPNADGESVTLQQLSLLTCAISAPLLLTSRQLRDSQLHLQRMTGFC